MIEVINRYNKRRWQELVSAMPQYDFYHTLSYHNLDRTGEPILFFYQENGTTILLPCLLRKIDKSPYYDITSVYGYVGPLCNRRNLEPHALDDFFVQLLDFFSKNSVISMFIRLHPLFDWQNQITSFFGQVVELNKTVYIDLYDTPDEQRRKYNKSLKHKINKLHREGFKIRKASTKEDLDSFFRIYSETMDRVHADRRYYFTLEYFDCFLKAEDYESFILLAEHGDTIAAGSLFTVCSQIMQYHLSGTYNAYLKYAPMKLVLDEARKIANDLNVSYFHLGGGVGGIDDSLFKFKAEFSDQTKTFKIWKNIIDQEKYDLLVRERFKNDIPESNFFPLYRA